MSKRGRPEGIKNLCENYCPILDIRPCPMFDFAVRIGLDGMQKCEIYEAVTELLEKQKGKR